MGTRLIVWPWTNCVTLTFYLTHDLDLAFWMLTFENNYIFGIISHITSVQGKNCLSFLILGDVGHSEGDKNVAVSASCRHSSFSWLQAWSWMFCSYTGEIFNSMWWCVICSDIECWCNVFVLLLIFSMNSLYEHKKIVLPNQAYCLVSAKPLSKPMLEYC